jgi:hypothetical protein
MSAAPELMAWVVTAQAAATFGMTGIIWLVQLVQYPGFRHVGVAEFGSFHRFHCRSIGLVVGPLMVLELLTASLLAAAGEPPWFWRIMLAALLVVWLSTALWQGPLHGRLSREGARPHLLRALLRGNWLRTILWTLRSAGLVWFYARGWAWS